MWFLENEETLCVSILVYLISLFYQHENMGSGTSERRKAASGGSSRTSRSSQYSVTHNSTEKVIICSHFLVNLAIYLTCTIMHP
jgi:hypothetical protein